MFNLHIIQDTLVPVAAGTLALFAGSAAWPQAGALTDQAITDKVEDELEYDHGVDPGRLGVTTQNGTVTLTGSVSNILALERAERVAETVRGVVGVDNDLVVHPAEPRSDMAIEDDVRLAVLQNPATEHYEVDVTVDGGIARVEGTVDSYQEHQLLRQVVRGVRGVRGLDDAVTVDFAEARPDLEIGHEIREALRWDLYVDANLVDVEVDQGAVTLRGTVGSASEKRRARSIAWVAGVRAVDATDLLVRYWARDPLLRGDQYAAAEDAAVAEAVGRALLYDPRIRSHDIDVDAAEGVVTLRGTVGSLSASWSAEHTARDVVGVDEVRNRLRILGAESTADNQIEEWVLSAVRRDPFLERFDLTVDVVDGMAHLYGSVDSNFERTHAANVAGHVRGVGKVGNHLDVMSAVPDAYDPYVDRTFPHVEEAQPYETHTSFTADVEIQEDIEDELWWSPFVDSDAVRVTVDDGIATLEGTVGSTAERLIATENAYQGGAVLVDNELTVE